MHHDLHAPAPSSGPILPRPGPAGAPALRSPGLAAMTRRYIDGEIDLRQLLAFDGAGPSGRPASGARRPY